MLIDWFTVGAQVVNFVILVWLMKHFLYKPILNAIDAREKRIASELADANAKKAEAEKERADFENKNKAFDDQRSALLSKATGDAKAEGAQLLDKARKDADSLRDTQAAALQNDHAKMGGQITRMATEEVFGIARKALSDLATVSLEERMGEVCGPRFSAAQDLEFPAAFPAGLQQEPPGCRRRLHDCRGAILYQRSEANAVGGNVGGSNRYLGTGNKWKV